MVSTYTGSDGHTREAIGAELMSGSKPLNLGPITPLAEASVTVDTSNTGNDLATLLGGTVLADAIAAGATLVLAWVETNDVRVSFLNNDPTTTGFLHAKGNSTPYAWDPSDLTKIRIVAQSANATVRVLLAK